MSNANELYRVAEISLIYKSKVPSSERIKVSSSSEVYSVFKSYYDDFTIELREEFKVLLLNRSNRCLGIYNLSVGSVTGTVVEVKHIILAAIKANSSSIILSHNHPSGNLSPSNEDIKITRQIKDAATLFGISVLDHIIVTSSGYFSFADDGRI